MKHFLAKAGIVGVAAAAIIALGTPRTVGIIPPVPVVAVAIAAETQPQHALETYLSALEWCESSGEYGALNPLDRDGTPSYSNFQWKPSTFLGYGKQYHLIPATTTLAQVPALLKNYQLQRSVVREMSQDPGVNWPQQFPQCTVKLGHPPRLSP